jgi:two-component system, sensor histidine kinase YesM
MKNIFNKFKNLKIRNKILLSYLLVLSFTIVTITVLTYKRSAKVMESQAIESTKRAFEQANTFISYKLNNVKDVSSMLFMNKEIQTILSKSPYDYPLGEQIDDYNRLIEILNSMQNSREIYGIRLYVNSKYLYAGDGNKIISEAKASSEKWYKEALERGGGIYWRSTYEYDFKDLREKQNLISIVRSINSGGFNGPHLGIISLDILERSIYEIVSQVGITESSEVFLVNNEGIIISSAGDKKLGVDISKEKYFWSIKEKNEGYERIKLGKETSIVYHKAIENTDWTLVSLIPVKEILKGSDQISRYMLLLTLLVSVAAISAAYYISGSITKRIRYLIKNMKKIEEDNWDVSITVDSTDEIGILQKNFNRMIDNIKRLIKEKYQAEIYKKNAELRALQAQINPHFLYNTLDMLCWMAMKYGAEDIVDIVGSLAKFFRLSLSNGKDIVSMEDEVTHVKMYMDIQSKRFNGDIEGIIDIQEDMYSNATVKLILQPLVENAIIHGIQESESKKGYVKITGKLDNNLIFLSVEDNGMGMDDITLNKLLTRDKGGGYGIKNVNERIKLYFGEQYGLTYQSEIGKGTIVNVTFPALPYCSDMERNI